LEHITFRCAQFNGRGWKEKKNKGWKQYSPQLPARKWLTIKRRLSGLVMAEVALYEKPRFFGYLIALIQLQCLNGSVGTSYMSDNQHMSVAMQRVVDFNSMVTQ
jgi:hypothetical protein